MNSEEAGAGTRDLDTYSRLFFEIQKPLPQSLTNVTDFSKVIPTIETFFREEDPPRRLIKMKW